jgi:hypothetical protein
MIKADVTFKEVDAPDNLWCNCGHTAPKEYKRNGSNSESLPIRFWHVTGMGNNITICEPCMTVVIYMAKMNKKGR